MANLNAAALLDRRPAATAGPAPIAPEAHSFREALGLFATGVTVITALDAVGTLCGLTANAFSALSLDPPLVLACLNHDARCLKAARDSGAFSVHILASDQDEVARGFARRGADKSAVCEWSVTDGGVPLLGAFNTALECTVHSLHPGGDHAILVGRVRRIHQNPVARSPLLYYQGRMFPLTLDA